MVSSVPFEFNSRRYKVVLMSPASRAGIAVMCSTSGTRYLQSNPMSRASDYESGFLQNLLTIEVTGTAVSMTAPAWTGRETTSVHTTPFIIPLTFIIIIGLKPS